MDKISEFLLESGFQLSNDSFLRDDKAYKLEIKLTPLKDNYILLEKNRIYDNQIIPMKNEVRKISKLSDNKLKAIIEDMSFSNTISHNFYHYEIYCQNCERNIIDKFSKFDFSFIKGFVGTHSTQFGRCVIMINKEKSNQIIQILQKIKSCPKCCIEILPDI